jgi:hypothetical protein
MIVVEVWREQGQWLARGADGAFDSVGGSAEAVLSDIGELIDDNAEALGE